MFNARLKMGFYVLMRFVTAHVAVYGLFVVIWSTKLRYFNVSDFKTDKIIGISNKYR